MSEANKIPDIKYRFQILKSSCMDFYKTSVPPAGVCVARFRDVNILVMGNTNFSSLTNIGK